MKSNKSRSLLSPNQVMGNKAAAVIKEAPGAAQGTYTHFSIQTSQCPLGLVLLISPVSAILSHRRNYGNLARRGRRSFSLLVHRAKETQVAPSCGASRSQPQGPGGQPLPVNQGSFL